MRSRSCPYLKDKFDYTDFFLGMDDESTESLWERTKEHTNMDDIEDVCHRPSDQEEWVDEARNSFTFTGHDSHEWLQLPWSQLKKLHSRKQAVQGFHGEHQWELPDPKDREANEKRCSTGPCAHQQRMIHWGCEGPRQPWLQWPQDGRIQDPEKRNQGKKKDCSPGLQKRSLWPLWTPTWRMPWEMVVEKNVGMFIDFSRFTYSKVRNSSFPYVGNQTNTAERDIVKQWDLKKRTKEGTWPGTRIERLSECAGVGLEKTKPTWSKIRWGT